MQKPTRELRQSNNEETWSLPSGLELGRAIYSKYASPGLVAPAAGLGLGQRTTLFGLERLPLLAAIQQRWSSNNVLPSGWPAHHYTWLKLFDRSKGVLAPRKWQTSPAAPSTVARTHQVDALFRPNSGVAEQGANSARPGSESSSQLIPLAGNPKESASLHLGRDPGTEVRPLDLTKPTTPNTPEVAGAEVYPKQEATMVQARSVRLASDASPPALDSPSTQEIVSNLHLAPRSAANIAPSRMEGGEDQPRSTSAVPGNEGSEHRSSAETVLAPKVPPGRWTTAATNPQVTPAVVTERLTSSIPQVGRAPTTMHISRALKDAPGGSDNSDNQVASKGGVARVSSTNSGPEVLESSAEVIGRKLSPTPTRNITSAQSFDVESGAQVRSGPILQDLRHLSVAKSGSKGEGSLLDQISQPSSTPGSSDSEGISATAEQRPSIFHASPPPSKPVPSAGVRVWLSNDWQNAREGSGHFQKSALGRDEADTRPGNRVDEIGSMVEVAGRTPEIGVLAGRRVAKIARALDSASSNTQSVMAAEASLPQHGHPILLRSRSTNVALPSGGRDQDLSGYRVFVPSPLQQANTREERFGVERVSRELTREIARDTEIFLSDGQVSAALALSTPAEMSSRTVALTLANALGRHSSANEPSSANAARRSGTSIMHLGFLPVRRANRSAPAVGHEAVQAAGIAHRAPDPFPPSSTAEPVNSTPARPILPVAGSRIRQAANIDLNQLANRVYELLVRRLASERQRRGL
jgi:hypothetical protein